MDKRPGFRKRIALELFRSIRRNRAKLHELRTLLGMYASLQCILPSLRQRLPCIGWHEGYAGGRFSESYRRYYSPCQS